MISRHVLQDLNEARGLMNSVEGFTPCGRGWTAREQETFWQALDQCPMGPWTWIARYIGTKSARQVMTHAQKLRQKLRRWKQRDQRLIAAAMRRQTSPPPMISPMTPHRQIHPSASLSSATATTTVTSTPGYNYPSYRSEAPQERLALPLQRLFEPIDQAHAVDGMAPTASCDECPDFESFESMLTNTTSAPDSWSGLAEEQCMVLQPCVVDGSHECSPEYGHVRLK